MALCPKCKTEQSKRKSGRCPKCMTKIDVYDGVWFISGDGSPTMQVIALFEKHVSAKLSENRPQGNNVVFKLNKKNGGYKRELVSASRILNIADNDMALINETFVLMFARKLYTTMIFIEREFNLFAAVAMANREVIDKKNVQWNKTIDDIMNRGSVFKNAD